MTGTGELSSAGITARQTGSFFDLPFAFAAANLPSLEFSLFEELEGGQRWLLGAMQPLFLTSGTHAATGRGREGPLITPEWEQTCGAAGEVCGCRWGVQPRPGWLTCRQAPTRAFSPGR